MAIAERLITMVAQWAKGAQTIIPNPPVPGIAYRNEAVSASDLESGQSYDKVYDSARYNQRDYLITGLLQLVEQCGVMPYSSLTNYPVGGFCLGQDGVLRQALQASGPDSGGARPTSNTSYWARRDFGAMVQGTRKINATAPLTGGGALTSDLTLGLNASVTPTASSVLLRDASGRSQVAAPSAAADIARKDTVDNAVAGAAPKEHASSATTYGRATKALFGHAKSTSTAPKAAGTAHAGSDNGEYANPDHIHPVQTSVSGNAGSASKLQTPRPFRVALNSTEEDLFDGSKYCVPGVAGVLGTENGGTGNNKGVAPSTLDVIFSNVSGLTMRGQGLLGVPKWVPDDASLDDYHDTGAYYVGENNPSTPFPSTSCLVLVQRMAGALGTTTGGAVFQWAYRYTSVEVDMWQRVRVSDGVWGAWRPAITNVTPLLCATITYDGRLASGGYQGLPITGVSKLGTGEYLITTSILPDGSKNLKPFVGIRGGMGYATAYATGVGTINVNTYYKNDVASDLTFHIVAFTA